MGDVGETGLPSMKPKSNPSWMSISAVFILGRSGRRLARGGGGRRAVRPYELIMSSMSASLPCPW